MYKVCFYVPLAYSEEVKNNMFAKGAGKIGQYSCCAWQTLGEGQFLPHENSSPFIGKANQLERTQEYKIEMVCDDQYLEDVIKALKASHPYEEPAYQVWKLESI